MLEAGEQRPHSTPVQAETNVPRYVFQRRRRKGVKQPYNDPLVITLTIEGINTKRILVNNDSSIDIIYLPAFQQLKLDPGKLRLFDSPLIR